jgi:hypothetical protein
VVTIKLFVTEEDSERIAEVLRDHDLDKSIPFAIGGRTATAYIVSFKES